MYIEGIQYANLIDIGQVVIEIRGVENSNLAVPVNNTLMRHTAFLAADTQPCVLMFSFAATEPPKFICVFQGDI